MLTVAGLWRSLQSSRHLLHWGEAERKLEGHMQQLGAHASASAALGMAPAPAEPLEPGGDLGLSSASSTDGLVMTNELQNLLAEMDWD